jgi:hypothetical protein
MLVGVPLFIVMVATAVAAWQGDRLAAVLLAVEGIVWLFVDKWFEGPILLRVMDDHGLVLADLVGLAALGGAGASLLRSRLRGRVRVRVRQR